ncbi:hypothetical protein JGU71_11560 [Antrihabitans sp. YC3-6]|uniref:Lipoprotein n=3 Tax=Antrihabitans TaxID=2799491 RepID=A0A934NQF6_9NOCA|nr:hypothetical protein [Antrihabitans stalagmiti]MBJ8339523.1 hypothetical protein [Antrihabitans stalagmiti]
MALGNKSRFAKYIAVAAAAATIPMLAACGGSDGGDSSAANPASADDFTFDTPSEQSSEAANVDVCALLSEQDAADVADAAGLAGGRKAGIEYSITATKVEYDPAVQEYSPTSGCKFVFDSVDTDGVASNSGVVVIETIPADNWDLYTGDGTPIPGLGDEASTVAGTSYVRVGDLMLRTGQNSFTDSFIVELYKKMAPNL